MSAQLPRETIAMLKKPNPAVLTTLRSDGLPVSVATWYLWEDDGRILINMDAGRVRVRRVHDNPTVALSVLDAASWYTYVSISGRVVGLHHDDGLRDIDRLARHYTGATFERRVSSRVSGWIEVDRWHGWGALK